MTDEIKRIKAGDHRDLSFFDALVLPDAGCFRSKGSHGCYKSHLQILKEAADANETVLILQDDCDFLPKIFDYTLPEKWDVFYGGYYADDPNDLHNTNIIGAHFMAFSVDAAKKASKYLEDLLDPAFPPDPIGASAEGFNPAIRPPIDGSLVWFRRAHPELKTIFALLSYQRPSRTDLGISQWLDRVPIMKQLSGLLRAGKRKALQLRYSIRQ